MLLAGLFGIVLSGIASAASTQITGLRTAADRDRSRLVFDLGGPVEHQIFTLQDPSRIVIDIEDVSVATDLREVIPDSDLIRRIRSATRNGNDLRVVLDLTESARPKSFVLKPAADYGHRLVVDVVGDQASGSGSGGGRDQPKADEPRDIVVAIDPGHGGHDPGAIGHGGVNEKLVVLQIARRLNNLLEETPGFKPVMTRNSDIYLPLRERMRRAREADADLFISLHADAFRDARARGSSVYALSTNGASSEAAKWIANRENSADMLGGVSLDDKDEMVASVLLDLSQSATIESSLSAGERILEQLGQVNRLHKHSVQQAGFVVLKAPDVPSLLVETAFISNPEEARNLRSSAHQQKLARAMRDGIREYFETAAPRGTRFYAQNN
ncbi:MAG: N-acetylmuramoyl-L-alanine amidase [Halofilum sp. (in: g-proteobacteria)]|nr:N-acetylmuramoyl-L-alanine amidase [Halofilum sp. (in: g-proteobacteria)]